MTRLILLLKHTYENVPFYHQKFVKAKTKPEDIRNVSDLKKIPLITREELQSLSTESITARNVNLEKCEKTITLGTTDTPLNLIIDKRATDYGNNLWLRMHERNGLRNRDRMAVIRHPNYLPKKYWF